MKTQKGTCVHENEPDSTVVAGSESVRGDHDTRGREDVGKIRDTIEVRWDIPNAVGGVSCKHLKYKDRRKGETQHSLK